MEAFCQEDDSLPKSSWQAAYDEHFLDETGTKVVGRMFDQQNRLDMPTRLAFFLHYVDFAKPLLWQDGELELAMPRPMPERLAKIIVYKPVD